MNNKGNEFPKATRFLNQWNIIYHEIESLKLTKENLMMLATSTTTHLTNMPRSDSPDLQRNQAFIAECADIDRQIAAKEHEANEKSIEIWKTIRTLENPIQEKIMILFYLKRKSIPEISDMLHYTEATIYKLKRSSLKTLEKSLP